MLKMLVTFLGLHGAGVAEAWQLLGAVGSALDLGSSDLLTGSEYGIRAHILI